VGYSLFILEANPAAKKDAICIRRSRVDDLKLIQSLLNKSDATINFPKPLFSIDIVTVFRAIPVERSRMYGGGYLRSLNFPKRV
jgi:hypothetical protein